MGGPRISSCAGAESVRGNRCTNRRYGAPARMRAYSSTWTAVVESDEGSALSRARRRPFQQANGCTPRVDRFAEHAARIGAPRAQPYKWRGFAGRALAWAVIGCGRCLTAPAAQTTVHRTPRLCAAAPREREVGTSRLFGASVVRDGTTVRTRTSGSRSRAIAAMKSGAPLPVVSIPSATDGVDAAGAEIVVWCHPPLALGSALGAARSVASLTSIVDRLADDPVGQLIEICMQFLGQGEELRP